MSGKHNTVRPVPDAPRAPCVTWLHFSNRPERAALITEGEALPSVWTRHGFVLSATEWFRFYCQSPPFTRLQICSRSMFNLYFLKILLF